MTADGLREKVTRLMPQAKADLSELVAFRSVADPKQFPPEECERAAQWVVARVAEAGLRDVRGYQTPDGSTAVVGQAPGPPGAPTVLLYCHHDVQPPLDEAAWDSPPFELSERDGRWYGRGCADCKGNIVMHLTALRALGPDRPVTIKFVSEGSEEQGTGGLEAFVQQNPDLLRADVIVIADAGNFAAGRPTLTTTLRGMTSVVVSVTTLRSAMHSGAYGGPAPDALVALVKMLATLHDEKGNATIHGLDDTQVWSGADYPPERFREDATVLEGVALAGDGTVAEMLWARPAVTILGIDCPPVVGSTNAIPAAARARVSLRVPPRTRAKEAQDALVAHLRAVVPWNAHVEIEREGLGEPFVARTDGRGFDAMADALREAYESEVTMVGQGGSIPLCNTLQATYPEAEIMLMGVEEPLCLIHAPNESVDPSEIEHIALAEALFLGKVAERLR